MWRFDDDERDADPDEGPSRGKHRHLPRRRLIRNRAVAGLHQRFDPNILATDRLHEKLEGDDAYENVEFGRDRGRAKERQDGS